MTCKAFDASLDDLLDRYPKNIPVREAAKVLGVGDKNLRAAIIQGNMPFAVVWRKDKIKKGVGVIPGQTQTRISTRAFIAWLTGRTGEVNGRAVLR